MSEREYVIAKVVEVVADDSQQPTLFFVKRMLSREDARLLATTFGQNVAVSLLPVETP